MDWVYSVYLFIIVCVGLIGMLHVYNGASVHFFLFVARLRCDTV